MLARRPATVVAPIALAALLGSVPCMAQTRDPAGGTARSEVGDTGDRFLLVARSETHVQLFRRALLPGPNGASVTTDTGVPIYEYLFADARDVDAPWREDSLDVEFGAWGRLWPTDSELERPFDGDVQTASIRYRHGPVWVRLGRQQVAGGAARYARFDGVMLGARHPIGLFAEAYSGFTVLPRWDGRLGYHHLGALEDEALRSPDEALDRRGHWLAGGRLGYAASRASGSISVHEQRERGGVARRNLGLDVGARIAGTTSAGASALLELDERRFANARAWLDATPFTNLDLGVEALRAEPALLLSRQSVFSVFAADGYEELGGSAVLRALRWLRFEAAGFVQLYDDGSPGSRGEITARITADRARRTLLRCTYARVNAPENGYHSVRASLSRQLTPELGSTLEAYGYFYDEPIEGYSTSSVYAGTLAYRPLEPLELLWGASLSRSPYAALDAQTLFRVVYEFTAPPVGRSR